MVANIHYRWDFIGLSTDTKPTPETSEKVVDGSTYYTSDDSKLYVWYKDQWYEKEVTGGGGGGGSYTAGDGIVIDNNEISVDLTQATGTSTTSVMSQKAVTGMIFNDPATRHQIAIGAGATLSLPAGAIAIGRNSASRGNSVSVGQGAGLGTQGAHNVNFGYAAKCDSDYSVALGYYAKTTRNGEVNVGTGSDNYGYNSTPYRIIGGVHDGQDGHDAVTKNQLDGRVKQNAGAPTTSTAGTVGQLLEDTTNGKLYQCTAIDNTDPNNPSYTWTEVGAGGGGLTVVQTTGTSTTDVMSQNAATSLVFADPSTKHKVQVGGGVADNVQYGMAIGPKSQATGERSIAIGGGRTNYESARAQASGSIAIGAGSFSNTQGVISVGAGSYTQYGYNNTAYRLLTGVHDGQDAHDAVTVEQVNATIDAINTALSTSIPHIGLAS